MLTEILPEGIQGMEQVENQLISNRGRETTTFMAILPIKTTFSISTQNSPARASRNLITKVVKIVKIRSKMKEISSREPKISTLNTTMLIETVRQIMTSIKALPAISTIGTIRSNRKGKTIIPPPKLIGMIKTVTNNPSGTESEKRRDASTKRRCSRRDSRGSNMTPNSISLSKIDIELRMMRRGWPRGKQSTKSTHLEKIVPSIRKIDSTRIRSFLRVGRAISSASILLESVLLSISGKKCAVANLLNRRRTEILRLPNSGLIRKSATRSNVSL